MRNERSWAGGSGGYLTLQSQNSVDLHALLANEIGPGLKVGLCETGCFSQERSAHAHIYSAVPPKPSLFVSQPL